MACAATGRYTPSSHRFRDNSRDTVAFDRPIRPAIALTVNPDAQPNPISSRSLTVNRPRRLSPVPIPPSSAVGRARLGATLTPDPIWPTHRRPVDTDTPTRPAAARGDHPDPSNRANSACFSTIGGRPIGLDTPAA
jgi:hypothetical protein